MNAGAMITQPRSRRASAKQVRDLQRLTHLLTGAFLIAYVYLPLGPSSPVRAGIRWIALPVLVASGLLMWQWPKLRRLARRRGILG
jgi:hypothetical protein